MRSLVLLSGGLDSAVALAEEKAAGYEVLPAFVDYGQLHERQEGNAAEAVAQHYGLGVLELSIPAPGESALTGGEGDLNSDAVVVPGRNLNLVTVAVLEALARNCVRVVVGVNASDMARFPDCRPEFWEPLQAAVRVAYGVEVVTPHQKRTKAEVVQRGRELDVPLELTWSCYAGGRSPCGECGACIERERALA